MQTEQIRQLLLERTGIDFQKYQTETLRNAISGLISFPSSVTIYMVIYPIFVVILGGVAGVLAWKYLGAVFAVSFISMTVLLFPFLGFFSGLLLFSKKVVADVEDVFGASVGILTQVADDLTTVQDKINPEKLAAFSFADILKGINAVVVVPVLVKLISDKIPLVGGRIGALIGRFLQRCSANSTNTNAPAASTPAETTATNNPILAYSQKLVQFANSTNANIGKITASARSFVIAPMRVTVYIILGTCLLWTLLGYFAFV